MGKIKYGVTMLEGESKAHSGTQSGGSLLAISFFFREKGGKVPERTFFVRMSMLLLFLSLPNALVILHLCMQLHGSQKSQTQRAVPS